MHEIAYLAEEEVVCRDDSSFRVGDLCGEIGDSLRNLVDLILGVGNDTTLEARGVSIIGSIMRYPGYIPKPAQVEGAS